MTPRVRKDNKKGEGGSSSSTILNLSRRKYVSAAALSSILKDINETGVPDAKSASTYLRQRKKACNRNTPLGNVMTAYTAPLLSGGDISIPMTNPYAFLYVALLDNAALRTFFRSVCDKHTNRLGIVSYTDEITPGDVLLSENPRKSHALYWSILQFGYPALGDENAWITAVAVRSNTVVLIDGGLSCLFNFF